jgi:uracil-DNA glycosylase
MTKAPDSRSMTNEYFDDKPKLLASTEARKAREAKLHDPHIAPLTAFVEDLRVQKGPDYTIPHFDPWDGGIDAEVLFLLEAPGRRAKGSGFISRNNPDETAKNFFEFNDKLIPRKRTITWNIVPWYIGDGSRIRAANLHDTDEGLKSLNLLLDLLPRLRTIVLLGRKAQRSSKLIEKLRPRVRLFASPHPSPLVVNRSPDNKKEICRVLQEVADYLT